MAEVEPHDHECTSTCICLLLLAVMSLSDDVSDNKTKIKDLEQKIEQQEIIEEEKAKPLKPVKEKKEGEKRQNIT